MAQNSLPLGFRFHPTDVELIMYYLKRKVMGKRILVNAIAELDIYKFAPWDLPDKSCLRSKDLEWYFFCPRERKYASGARTNRATDFGHWKVTGKDRSILYNEKKVGMIKTLIFHEGRAPKGNRTDWVMYEFRLDDEDLVESGVVQDAYVLCKIFKKIGPGPRNGAQYGAPFNEGDWNDDEEVAGASLFPLACQSRPALVQPNDTNIASSLVPGTIYSGPSFESGPSQMVPPTSILPVSVDDVNAQAFELPQIPEDDILLLLEMFTDYSTALPNENGENMELDKLNNNEIAEGTPLPDCNDIYNCLDDLDVLNSNEGNFASEQGGEFVLGETLATDGLYLELNDLMAPLVDDGDGSYKDPAYVASECYTEDICQLPKSYGGIQHPVLSEPLLLQGAPPGFEDHLITFSKENGAEIDNHGHEESEVNLNNAELGGTQSSEVQTRGEQRTNYSRLQYLLESIPARPASATEHYAPAYATKGLKGHSNYFSPYGGSAIHVKVAVGNLTHCGYTEYALSDSSREYQCLIGYEPNQPREKLKMGMASHESGFSFVFLLGMILAFIWIFLATVVINLGRYGWNLILS